MKLNSEQYILMAWNATMQTLVILDKDKRCSKTTYVMAIGGAACLTELVRLVEPTNKDLVHADRLLKSAEVNLDNPLNFSNN